MSNLIEPGPEALDVTGIDLAELLVALYAGTAPLGLGAYHDKPDGLSLEEARGLIESGMERQNTEHFGLHFDYVAGRPIKTTLIFFAGKTFIKDARLYDRDAGPGACAHVVSGLRP